MLFSGKENLAEQIVLLLTARTNTSAEALLKFVNKNKIYTLQAVYKELRKLQAGGIVVKIGKGYSLRLSWLLQVSNAADQSINLYTQPDILKFEPGYKKQTWQFNSLLKANNFWAQVLILLMKDSREKVLYSYAPHAWYHLAQTQAEDQYLKSIKGSKGKIYFILTNNTFLDKWVEQFYDRSVMEFGYTKKPLFTNEEIELDVIDDYIITSKKDAVVTKNIADLYNKATKENFNIGRVVDIFTNQAKVKVTLERNPKKAALYKKKFKQFFG